MLFFCLLFCFTCNVLGSDQEPTSSTKETTSAPLYIALGGTILTAFLYTKRESDDGRINFKLSNDPLLHDSDTETIGKIGSGWLYFLYVVPTLSAGYIKSDESLLNKGEYVAKVGASVGFTTWVLKKAFQHERPGIKEIKNSFPSGHAASSFAFATAISLTHEWYWGVLANLIATVITYSRLDSNRHYLYDITGGMTLGISMAWLLHKFHEDKSNYWLTLSPADKLDGISIKLGYRF